MAGGGTAANMTMQNSERQQTRTTNLESRKVWMMVVGNEEPFLEGKREKLE